MDIWLRAAEDEYEALDAQQEQAFAAFKEPFIEPFEPKSFRTS